MYNIVTVTFKDSNTATANGVRQWDYGQILRIQGLQLPTAVEVHFALIDSKDSVTRIGITKDGVTDVVIPDSMIEAGKNIFAYVYLRDSESGQTEYEIKIVVTTRAKPEAFDTPEDKELFAQAIEAVNEAADRAEKAGQAATEAAGQAAEDAQQTAEDRKEVAKMVETVSDISEQVKKVEELSNKAQESATQAGTSATAAEKAKAQAETAAGKTAEDRTAVNQAKIAVDEAQKAVRADRAAVEEAKQSVEQLSNAIPESTQVGVQAVNQARQTAVDEIARTGTSHKTAVEGAGTQAVESVENVQQVATEAVETAKTEAVQAVQAEGAKQIKEVRDKGAEVLQSIPEDFATQMETKLNKQQGIENKGKVLVIGEDGNVVPEEVASGGGDGIAIINTMSGESPLVIPDSAERVNKRLELGGKTEQVQTSGKNVWDPNAYTDFGLNENSANSIRFENDVVTYISDKGTYDQIALRIPIGKLQIGDYKVSFGRVTCKRKDTIKTESGTLGASAFYKDSVLVTRGVTFSVDDPNADYSMTCSGFSAGNNGLLELSVENPMISQISVGTYEPYTGGKPSPSPEYPQEIKNVGKWNEGTRKYEVDIEISGNFFDVTKVKTKTNLINNGDGSLHVINKNVIESELFGKLCPDLKVGETCVMRLESTGLSYISVSGMVWDTGQAKTITQNILDSTVYFYGKDGSTVVIKNIRITRNTGKNMEYTPYRKPQLLTLTSDRSITKWDRLVEQGGEIGWLYKSKIDALPKTGYRYIETGYFSKGNVFTDSALNSTVTPGSQFFTCFSLANPIYKKGDIAWLYVNKSGTTDLRVRFADESINTAELFEKYMADKDMKILYETAQPEFVPLPQSEQNAIRALKTYYPTTVITADGGELDPDIKVTYTADTKNYIDGKVSAKVASILRQYQADTANLLSLMPMETQAAMIENDTNNILENAEEMKHE